MKRRRGTRPTTRRRRDVRLLEHGQYQRDVLVWNISPLPTVEDIGLTIARVANLRSLKDLSQICERSKKKAIMGKCRMQTLQRSLRMLKSAATPPQAPQPPLATQAQVPPRSLRTRLSWFDKTLRNVWFYVAAASLVLNITYTFRPQITIQSASTIDNPSESLFIITNNGFWTLYDVAFYCAVNGNVSSGNIISRDESSAPEGNGLVSIFSPGQTATRDCGGMALGRRVPPDSVRIDLLIVYKWAWGIFTSPLKRHFDTRRVQGHVILVPDVEPSVFPSVPGRQ